MKAASVSTILSVLSLIAVGAMFVKMENLSDQIRPLTERRADADRRQFDPVDDYEREPGARPIADESEARDGPFGSDGEGTSTAESRSDKPATRRELERRIAQLEKKQSRPALPFRMPKFARSVSDLSKTLKLTKTQEARVQDVVDRTKQRIEDD